VKRKSGEGPPVQVVLLRHAHADWPLYSGLDINRPLTPRGEEDARAAAHAIRAAGFTPALLLVSPALRTRQTAELVAREFVMSADQLRFIDALYNARAAQMETALRKAARQSSSLLMVAHNPGISELARRLSGDPARASFPPAGWDRFTLAP
jgi:phosphohistidine phosphatase